MPVITLPDNSTRHFSDPVTIMHIANDIGAGLAKATLAGKVNGQLVDASHIVDDDSTIEIITSKSEEGVDIIRHSTAHLLAQAVKSLFPNVQVTIGPVIDDGFYYDFSSEHTFSETDLENIEKKMSELSGQGLSVERLVMDRDEAISHFKSIGEEYKAEIISDIPAGETLSLYRQGDFMDLCRGPHVPNTKHLKAFKLTKVAGAYWRGDSNNAMLQRIYGTAWSDKKALKSYLFRMQEAERRDHRKLAKQLDLFHIQEEAPGMVFWHPRGWSIYQTIESYMRDMQNAEGYQEIKTPQIVDYSLWQKSGHADKYSNNMYSLSIDERRFAVKPMNCPCHVQVFNHGLKSYRDLPLRLAEFGSCHRNELSGALHGLMRVRGFTQDDAHIFCTEDQIQVEVSQFIKFLHRVYEDFGFEDIIYRLSTRPQQRVGSEESWDKSEKALAEALDANQLEWEELPGEGAFYGPKIEFSLKDCIGRVWQCGTIQVDFSMPGRLDASYIDENGEKKMPVMLHRAILGSFERFMGILIEHHEGKFPVWLAPEQVVILNITQKHEEYATNVLKTLQKHGLRVISDLRNEKIGFKIRHHTLQRVPYLLVVGDKESEMGEVAVRTRSGEDLGTMKIDEFVALIDAKVNNHQ